jgi:hypothetical protein
MQGTIAALAGTALVDKPPAPALAGMTAAVGVLSTPTSGADLTFAIVLTAISWANVKSKAPLESTFGGGPLIPTFANVTAAVVCEC